MKKNILIALLVVGLTSYWATLALAQDPKVFEKNARVPGANAMLRPTYYTEMPPYVTGLDAFFQGSVAWGDYDNDGYLDILMTGQGYGNSGFECMSKIYHNNDGDGSFTAISAPLIGVKLSSAAWGDYDNDNDLDVVLCGQAQDDTAVCKVYENQGEGVFAENPDAVLTGVYKSGVAWGDYDNDGKLDILLSGDTDYFDGFSEIYRNDGGGTFSPVNAGLIGFWDASAAWGDCDNDGDLDVLLSGGSNEGENCSKVYRNDGKGTFTSVGGFMTGAIYGSASWGDYDNDGDLDFLVTGSTVYIYRNVGNNVFFPTGSNYFPDSLYQSSAAWGDCDNDGDLDIVLTGDIGIPESISRVYLNIYPNPIGFVVQDDLGGIHDGSVAWGDYDNDGDLDILQAGFPDVGNAYHTLVYQNIFASANTPPEVPASLKAVVGIKKVTLRWDKSSDEQTPQNGLNYNLYVGTEKGLGNIVSPMANISNGWRKVTALGSQNENTSWVIKNLPEGKYFWGVQALDTAFAGSMFATGSFVVKPGFGIPPDPGPTGK